jgi:membrane-bound lytic murein transglycosylase D
MIRARQAVVPALTVAAETDPGSWRNYRFDQPFKIGRLEDCGLCINNPSVSRTHAEVAFEGGQWCIRDLDSANGIFFRGKRVRAVAVDQLTVIRLGEEGPELRCEAEFPEPEPLPEKAARGEDTALDTIIGRYFKADVQEPLGERTRLIRRAYTQIDRKQRTLFGVATAALLALMLGAASLAYHEHAQLIEQRETAEQLFYAIKGQDVELASLDRALANSTSPGEKQQLTRFRAGRQEMERNYDQYLATLQIYNPKLTEKQRLLMRVARIFGECELEMPAGFEAEINRYIERWRSTGRLKSAILTAKHNGYTETITRELLARGLAPQFFYLALQESNFDPYAVGPATRKGFAKGMWQFIPETAVKYNLHLGPLVDQARADPADDRHNYIKETKAAALYLQDLTATDAQASGFLVMACYNWGETQILPLIQSMPANPRERNFWKLLAKHRDKIPQETYDYVFSIASAAVIGENPRLFGFDFENPLTTLAGDDALPQMPDLQQALLTR